jgi:hypothetical protein
MPLDLLEIASSFSTTGTKRITVHENLDEGFFRLTDSGGIISGPADKALSFNKFCENSTMLYASKNLKEGRFFGFTYFDNNSWVIWKNDDVRGKSLLDLIINKNPEEQPLIFFPAYASEAEVTRIFEQDIKRRTHTTSLLQKLRTYGAIAQEEIYISIQFTGDELKLFINDLLRVPLPLAHLRYEFRDDNIKIKNQLMVGSHKLCGFSIEFPSSGVAAIFAQKMPDTQSLKNSEAGMKESNCGLLGKASITGVVNGRFIEDKECYVNLTSLSLSITEIDSTNEICSFDLLSKDLAIDGTSESFLISSDDSLSLKILSKDHNFLNAISTNAAVQAAAFRSCNTGPFIAMETSGHIVRFEIQGTHFNLSFSGNNKQEVASGTELPELVFKNDTYFLKAGECEFEASLPTLEGIAGMLYAINYNNGVGHIFEQLCSLMLGAEGQYLTYCVFGNLAETQIRVSDAIGYDETMIASELTGTTDQQKFLGIMATIAAPWSRDMEAVIHYLPSFILARDIEFLSHVNLQKHLNYDRIESVYSQALGCCLSLVSHLTKIDGIVSRFSTLQANIAKQDDSHKLVPLGASLAVGVFHPFALLGAINHISNLTSGNKLKDTLKDDSFREAASSATQEWDFIIHSLLPAFSSRFAKTIYPIRLALIKLLLTAYKNGNEEERANLAFFVCQRLGRLTASFDFPTSLSSGITRNECVDFLMQQQRNSKGIQKRFF